MKGLQFIVVVLLTVTLAKGQSPADKIFEKYAGREGYTTVFISKYMFDLFSNIELNDPEAKEMSEVISKLTGIRILATEQPDESINFYKEMKKEISSGIYKELMTIKEQDQDVQFLVNESEGKVTELLLIVSGQGENVLISIQGDINMKNIAKLANIMDIEGMDELENIDK